MTYNSACKVYAENILLPENNSNYQMHELLCIIFLQKIDTEPCYLIHTLTHMCICVCKLWLQKDRDLFLPFSKKSFCTYFHWGTGRIICFHPPCKKTVVIQRFHLSYKPWDFSSLHTYWSNSCYLNKLELKKWKNNDQLPKNEARPSLVVCVDEVSSFTVMQINK